MSHPVSVVMTVFNEASNMEAVLGSLLGQSRPPDEIVVVDGGSTDSTVAILERMSRHEPRLRFILKPGANISQGRNAAIEATRHELIAVTDAGTRLPTDWLQNLLAPFDRSDTSVVAGFFRSDPHPASPFQIAMGATVLPASYEINPATFLPSSRSVAFWRSAWRSAGGYPEWLDYCEDLIFDLNLKKLGYKFSWQPRAVALFAPRASLRAFWQQYYRYARGDGKAGLFLKRHLLRYFSYGVVGPLGVGLAWRKTWLWPLVWLAGLAYLSQPYQRLFFYLEEFHALDWRGKLAAIGWVPLIRATGDLAKMAGYPVGLRWRRSNPVPAFSARSGIAIEDKK